MSSKKSDIISVVCYRCFSDKYLQERINHSGKFEVCDNCGKKGICIDITTAAEWIGNIINEHYEYGEEHDVLDKDANYSHTEEDGEDLMWVIGEIIDTSENVHNAIYDALTSELIGGRYFCSDEHKYVEKPIDLTEHESKWIEFKNEIKHRSRFINSSVKYYLDNLFKDVAAFRAFDGKSIKVIHLLTPSDHLDIYRARRIDKYCEKELKLYLKNPSIYIGPPPPDKAPSGRMNAVGVSVFYGAFDRKTCIAELRPSLGGILFSAKYKLKKPIRVLDFHLLENCYHDQQLSYFQPDFNEKIANKNFLQNLHKKISMPILPGEEQEYIYTQVLADYLRDAISPQIDGIIFSSVQNKGGKNIVIWGDALDIKLDLPGKTVMGPKSVLKMCGDSILYHNVRAINYKCKEGCIPRKSKAYYIDYDIFNEEED